MLRIQSVLFFIVILPLALQALAQIPGDLKSQAEASNFEETARYTDVIDFLKELQKRSPLLRMETLGSSHEGRQLPLMILSDPPVSTPREASQSGKPVVFLMANIHAGEVEGKEAAQHLARRILLGELKPLLSKLTILIAPIFNADGNEKVSLENRTEQFGPIGGVGVRTNSQSFDLNRDFIKLESPEVQALVNLYNRWDPHLIVDLHTTNGSYHAYHLTYSHPLNPNSDNRILVPLSEPVDILVGEVEKIVNPRSGKAMTAMIENKVTPIKMVDFGMVVATRSVKAPRAYLFAYDEKVVQKCLQHGVVVEELTSDLTTEVECLTVGGAVKSKRVFQGHFETKITGEYSSIQQTFPSGTMLVRTAQPLSSLVCYLLEPESEDGLVTWNFFDSYLETGKVFPVYKLMRQENIASVRSRLQN